MYLRYINCIEITILICFIFSTKIYSASKEIYLSEPELKILCKIGPIIKHYLFLGTYLSLYVEQAIYQLFQRNQIFYNILYPMCEGHTCLWEMRISVQIAFIKYVWNKHTFHIRQKIENLENHPCFRLAKRNFIILT